MSKSSVIVNNRYWSFWPEETFENIRSTERQRTDLIFFISVLFCSALLNGQFLYNELWQDELYTLYHFVFVPLKTTLTDYHVTNNHIVFNLVMSAYLKATGVSFETVQRNPEIARIIPYLFTITGIAAFYFLSRKVFGSLFANALLVVYCTTLQLYTFGDQCRGYALEISLSAINILLILRFVQKKTNGLLFWIALTGALMLINLPSTVYYYLALILMPILAILLDHKKRRILFATPELKVSTALTAGFLIFVSYFLLIIGPHQLSNNDLLYAKNSRLLDFIRLPFSVVYRFFDWRVFLLLPFAYAVFMRLRKKWNHRVSSFLLLSFFLPFILFAIHGPEIIHRIWIPLLPLFSILIVHLCYPLINFFQVHKWKLYFVNLLILLCSFYFLKRSLLANNETNHVTLDLRYQYHLYRFNTQSVLDTALKEAAGRRAQIEICENFPAGIDFTRQLYNIDSINLINRRSRFLILITDDLSCLRKYSNYKVENIFKGKEAETYFYKCYVISKEF